MYLCFLLHQNEWSNEFAEVNTDVCGIHCMFMLCFPGILGIPCYKLYK